MKKVLMLVLAVLLLFTCAGCNGQKSDATISSSAPASTGGEAGLQNKPNTQDAVPNTESILSTYYAAQSEPAFDYFQNNSIQRFLAMWVEEATGDIVSPEWNLDSFARFQILDHNLQPATREEQELYYCTFSDGEERFGYAIFLYEENGPSIENYGVHETTPYVYDLAANLDAITESLSQTDIDLSTATAARVSWLDTANNRSDQVILFQDARGGVYLCYLGDSSFEIEAIK